MARFELTGDPNQQNGVQWQRVKGLADVDKHGSAGYVRGGTFFSYEIEVYDKTLNKNSLIDNINKMVDDLNLSRPVPLDRLDHVWLFGLLGPSDEDVKTTLTNVYKEYVQNKNAAAAAERQSALHSLVSNPDEFRNLAPKFKNDLAFLKDAVQLNEVVLKGLPAADVQSLVHDHPHWLQFAIDDHRNDKAIVDAAYNADPASLQHAERQGVIHMIEKYKDAFKHAGAHKEDSVIIYTAYIHHGETEPIFDACIKSPAITIEFDTQLVQIGDAFVLKLYQAQPEIIKHCGKGVALILVKHHPELLKEVKRIHKDFQFLKDACKANSKVLEFLEKDPVIELVVDNPDLLLHAGKLLEDREFMFALPVRAGIRKTDDFKIEGLFKNAPPKFQQNTTFISLIFQALPEKSPCVISIYKSLADAVKKDRDITAIALAKNPAVRDIGKSS